MCECVSTRVQTTERLESVDNGQWASCFTIEYQEQAGDTHRGHGEACVYSVQCTVYILFSLSPSLVVVFSLSRQVTRESELISLPFACCELASLLFCYNAFLLLSVYSREETFLNGQSSGVSMSINSSVLPLYTPLFGVQVKSWSFVRQFKCLNVSLLKWMKRILASAQVRE